jgi:hypothetical protein
MIHHNKNTNNRIYINDYVKSPGKYINTKQDYFSMRKLFKNNGDDRSQTHNLSSVASCEECK